MHSPRLALITCLIPAVALLTFPQSTPAAPTVTVGISVDTDPESVRDRIVLLVEECEALMKLDFELRFPDDKRLGAGSTREGARAANDRLLSDPEVDLVIGLGPLSSVDLATRGLLPKPAIAPIIVDSGSQGVPQTETGTSGVANLAYVEPVYDFAHDVRRMRELVPVHRLAVIATPGFLEAIPGAKLRARTNMTQVEIEIDLVPAEGSAEEIAASIPGDVDAAYLVYLSQSRDADYEAIVQALTAKGIPTFAGSGEIGVRRGALMGLAPASWQPRLLRRTALLARRMLTGEDGANLPVQLSREESLFLNMTTARALNISPSFSLMIDATLVGRSQREPERTLDLPDVVREVLRNNRDLASTRREVEAGKRDVSLARSVLRPQIDGSVGARLIDEDRAAAGSSGAERTWVASLSASQILWSEQAWANLTIRKHLQRALDLQLAAEVLDVGLAATQAYYDVLLASAQEQIYRENVRLTRSNLERAQLRSRLGEGSPAETYRWESQIASDQDALVTAIAQRNVAEIQLNRLMHLPLEGKLGLVQPQGDDGVFRHLDVRLLPYVSNADGLARLRAHAAGEAKENSPELAGIDAAIEAQERLLRSTTARFFSPDVVLQGEITETLDRSGAGAEIFDQVSFDDTDWEVSLGLSLPLFTGGSRLAERAQAREDLARLEREREAVEERIEQRVRSAIHVASASFTRIDLTRAARDAAARNLDLVADAYGRGAVSIIDLLDAQTAHFGARQQEAAAVYTFLSDVAEAERAIGKFFFLATQEERDEMFRELEQQNPMEEGD